uniref:Non-haem dioxygenase N-terminal domain-containing protein n=1 Tax=Salix viminalis TaxID=40686 RepID=A0A6N2LY89_SALVM
MEIPVIDLSRYLEIADQLGTEPVILSGQIEEFGSWLGELCKEVSQILRETGALVVKDPRCTAEDNDKFIDMMEKYFERPREFKLLQERSHLHYQVGVTPEGVEVPRSLVDEEMQKKLKAMPKEFQPSTPSGPDPKWRYMWRVGPRPSNTRFKELNSEPVIPEGFPEWKDTMDSWGCKMISTIEAVAEMAAIGFGLSKCAFTSLMKQGPHLLAPTGSDLSCHRQEGTVFAGYHYDLNFLTIHGRSRFPGLNIWLRNGQKIEVKVPSGCLLIQTGKQIEWLTAGECMAGMHEVVVTNRTIDAIKLASQQNRSLWRVSSTVSGAKRTISSIIIILLDLGACNILKSKLHCLENLVLTCFILDHMQLFAHIASDAVLKPLGHFVESPLASKYPPMCSGEFVEQELAVINLKGNKGES